jgi:dipeptidase
MPANGAIVRILLIPAVVMTMISTAMGAEQNNCFSIVVGKNASADGHLMVAHNEDDGPPQVVNHQKMPGLKYESGERVTLLNGGEIDQPAETWGYIWSEIPGLRFSDSYINEHGVTVCSDACPSREDQAELTDGGISYYLRRLVAERATSAREGVLLAGELIERFGYDGSGRTYIIADPNEGWLLAAVNGKHWVARRVPDDSVVMIANTYSIHEIDLSDSANFLAAPDIIEYAIARGWYDPDADGEFDFAAVYAKPEVAADGRNIGRQWSAFRQITDNPPEYNIRMPFCISPDKKLHPRDLMSVLRDHYEGTDLYENPESGNPHDQDRTPICRHDTQTSFVAQLRHGMTTDVGVIYWVCLGSPCSSIFRPFYFGVEYFPSGWYTQAEAPDDSLYEKNTHGRVEFVTETECFWNFSRLRTLIEQNPESGPKLRAVAESIEDNFFELLADAQSETTLDSAYVAGLKQLQEAVDGIQ